MGCLGAAQEGTRLAAQRSMSAIIAACLDEASVSRAASLRAGGKAKGVPPGVVGLAAGVADALGPQHVDAWPYALPGALSSVSALCCCNTARREASLRVGGKAKGSPPGVVSLAAGVADALGPQHNDAWPYALPGAPAHDSETAVDAGAVQH